MIKGLFPSQSPANALRRLKATATTEASSTLVATISNNTGATYSGLTLATLREGNATTNYDPSGPGSSGHQVQSYSLGSRAHILVNATGLSNITSGTVVSSSLKFNTATGLINASFTFVLRKMLAASDVTQVTWNNRLNSIPWGTAGCLGDGVDRNPTVIGQGVVTNKTTGEVQISGAGLNQAVQDLINGTSTVFWFEIEELNDTAYDGSFAQFLSHAQTDGQRPVLTVNYLSASPLDKVPSQLKQQAPYIRTALAATAITSLLSPALFAPAVLQDPVPASPAQTAPYLRTVAPNPQQLNSSWLLQSVTVAQDQVPASTNQSAAYVRYPANLTKQIDNNWIDQLATVQASIPASLDQTSAYSRGSNSLNKQLDNAWLLQLTPVVQAQIPASLNQNAAYNRTTSYLQKQIDNSWLLQPVTVVQDQVPAQTNQSASYLRTTPLLPIITTYVPPSIDSPQTVINFQDAPYLRTRDNNSTQLDTRWLFQLPFIPNTSDPIAFKHFASYLRFNASYPAQLNNGWLLQLQTVQDPVPAQLNNNAQYIRSIGNYAKQIDNTWLLQLTTVVQANVPASVYQQPYVTQIAQYPQQLNTNWILQLPFIPYADVPVKPNVSAAYLRNSLVNPQPLDSTWLTRITTLDPVPAQLINNAQYSRPSANYPKPLDASWLTQLTTVASTAPLSVYQVPFIPVIPQYPAQLNLSWLLQQQIINYASITPLPYQTAAYNRVQPALPTQLNTSFLTQFPAIVYDPVPSQLYQTAPQIPPYYQVTPARLAQRWLLEYVNPVIPPIVTTAKIGGDDVPRIEIWSTRQGKKKLKEIETVVKAEFEELTGNLPTKLLVNKVVNQFKNDADLAIMNLQLAEIKEQIKQLIQDEQDEEDVMMLMMGFM